MAVPGEVDAWIAQVASCWASADAEGLGACFALKHSQAVASAAAATPEAALRSASAALDDAIRQPAGLQLLCMHHLAGDGGQACALAKDALNAYVRVVQSLSPEERPASLPGLKALCRNLLVLSGRMSGGRAGQQALKACQEELLKVYRVTIQRRGNAQGAVLAVCAMLCSIYFRLSTFSSMRSLFAAVDNNRILEAVESSKADEVCYKFYCGRFHMFEDNFGTAERYLSEAFSRCDARAPRNKRRILTYLLPIRILQGRLPRPGLLEKYGLGHYKGICEGVRSGDLRAFERCLVANQRLFIKQGTFLVLERTRRLVYRTLFKRVHAVAGAGPTRSRVPLAAFERAMAWLGGEGDPEQVECILANLIHKGYVKGYVAHAQRLLVVAKTDPFPTGAVIQST